MSNAPIFYLLCTPGIVNIRIYIRTYIMANDIVCICVHYQCNCTSHLYTVLFTKVAMFRLKSSTGTSWGRVATAGQMLEKKLS